MQMRCCTLVVSANISARTRFLQAIALKADISLVEFGYTEPARDVNSQSSIMQAPRASMSELRLLNMGRRRSKKA